MLVAPRRTLNLHESSFVFMNFRRPGKESRANHRNSLHHGQSKSIEARPGAFCPASQTAALHHKSFFICMAVAGTCCQVGEPAAALCYGLSRVHRPAASGQRESHTDLRRRKRLAADQSGQIEVPESLGYVPPCFSRKEMEGTLSA